MYNGVQNQGMRGIKSIIERENEKLGKHIFEYRVFETRLLNEHPEVEDFDIFISTGGPGDPFDGLGDDWEVNYFQMLDKIQEINSQPVGKKKFIFSICHSFQLLCRYFNIARVSRRRRTSFGVFHCHATLEGQHDYINYGLQDPFYIFDNRDWQCIDPDFDRLRELGIQILAVEKYRPHVDLQQALMALRISPYWVGTQFHPEADPIGMKVYFSQEEKRESVIAQHGEEKFNIMINNLDNPEYILKTNHRMLPNFLTQALGGLGFESSLN